MQRMRPATGHRQGLYPKTRSHLKPLQRRWVLASTPARCRWIAGLASYHQAIASTLRRPSRLPQEPGCLPPKPMLFTRALWSRLRH